MTGVQMAALAKKWGEHRAKPVIDKNAFNSILESAKTKDAAIIMFANLKRAGYRTNKEAYEQFQENLNHKYTKMNFNTAKKMLEEKTSAYGRKKVYKEIYKNFDPAQRKILAYYRNFGHWWNSPTSNSPKTERKKKFQTNFANYWSKLNANNRQTVRNYIESYKNKLVNAKKNLNAIKTDVGRKAWLKAKAHNFSPTEHAELRKHAKNLLEANRARRATKKKPA